MTQVQTFEHFTEAAALAGKAYAVETMYRQCAEQADAAGEHAAAAQFREFLSDERKHRDAFAVARANLTAPDVP